MEIDETTPVSCSGCGRTAPRGDMFGVEPDLLCETCAEGVRKRMHVRFRPLEKEHLPRATAACLAIMAVVFVCTDLIWRWGPGVERPAWLLALYQDETIWTGAVWKHLTCIFLHGGWWHVLMNAGALWWLGRPIEARFGTLTFLGLLVATGVAASAGEWIMSGGGVGMSGAIFGLAGFLIARRRFDPTAATLMHDGAVRWVLGWGLLCVVLTMANILNIGNWAHGVGLATGFGFGWATGQPARKLLVPAVALVCVGLVVASVFLAFGEVPLTNGEVIPRADWREIWLQRQP